MKRYSFWVLALAMATAGFDWPQAGEKRAGTAAPDVAGAWSGTWGSYPAEAKDKPAMPMDCLIVRKGDAWHATFEGECGRPYKYTIQMDGRQVGEAVLFKGSADLGEKDGGVYDWIGRATGQEFVGFYTSENHTGVFRLTRKK
jgi:hypothetical protein